MGYNYTVSYISRNGRRVRSGLRMTRKQAENHAKWLVRNGQTPKNAPKPRVVKY